MGFADSSTHPAGWSTIRYRFAARRFAVVRVLEAFFGTFAPSRRASDRPMAIACLRLVTRRPARPLFSVPALRSFITRPTLADAFFEYFRAMDVLPVASGQIRARRKVPREVLKLQDARAAPGRRYSPQRNQLTGRTRRAKPGNHIPPLL